MPPAEQPRAAGSCARGALERRDDRAVGGEAQVIIRREVDSAVELVPLNLAIPSSSSNTVEVARETLEVAHAVADSNASKNASISVSVEHSGGTSWITWPMGRVKWPSS